MNKKFSSKYPMIYILTIGLSIIPILYTFLGSITYSDLSVMFFWVLLISIAEYKPIKINMLDENDAITLSFAVHLSAIILLGVEQAVCVTIISTLIVETVLKKPWYKKIFNAGQYGITVLISGLLFEFLKLSPEGVTINILADIPAIFVSSTAYILLNSFFVSVIIYLTIKDKFIDIFLTDFKVVISYFYSLVCISVAVSYIYNPDRPFTILIMVPPLILMDQSVRRYYRLQSEAKSTLTVLAQIIDQRDKYTYEHSSRVAKYAKEISEQLNISSNETVVIETAGLVHDLGKISIEDKIINKDGKLTDEEYNLIQAHPMTGYRLLENIHPYRKSAQYVLYHHEKFGGGGYPINISGYSIPLGARILAVADSYDAMTSDRSYRKALAQSKAVSELIRGSGTQFDPVVVNAFIEVLKDKYGYTEEETNCL
jgi:HD-GYP domain-containing protein (c-di-GMP phosphodiesterase class II)